VGVGSLLGFVSEEKVEVRLRTPETSICFLLLGFACKVKRCAFPNFNHTHPTRQLRSESITVTASFYNHRLILLLCFFFFFF